MGIFDGVAADIEPSGFFSDTLPGAFDREMAGVSVDELQGTELKVIFNVEGEPFGLTLKDATSLEMTPGGMDSPDIEIGLSKDAWKATVSGELGNALDMFTDFKKLADRRRYDTVKEVKGKLNLVLKRAGADDFTATAKFGGSDSPEATITTDLETWKSIMSGENQAVTAFMGGKLSINGEMVLAMKLNQLM